VLIKDWSAGVVVNLKVLTSKLVYDLPPHPPTFNKTKVQARIGDSETENMEDLQDDFKEGMS
jgi:hypothetical protein